MSKKVVRSACRACHGGCGVLVTVEDNRVTQIKGDPECPVNRGWLCVKGKKYHTITHHPDRLTHPLRKVGDSWQRITWDEALDLVSQRFLEYKQDFGAESVVFGYGTGRDNEAFIFRLANTFGSPNVISAGHMCYAPRIVSGITRCGNLPVVDYEGNPSCVIVWGANPLVSNPDEYKGLYLAEAMKKGAKIICVDPRRSMVAKQAHIWLRLRPGTDGALAWGMVNHIIDKQLFDAGFVEDHVHGWDEFRARAKQYPLEWAAAKTGLQAADIAAAAEMYAQADSGGIHWGVALEQTNNSINNISLLIGLMAITGNLDRPGGNVFYPIPPIVNASQLGAHRLLDPDAAGKRLGSERFRLANVIGAQSPLPVWKAILEEDPYPVKALHLISTNPVITRANAKMVREALATVDFLVVQDFFMTPSADLADVVLPASTWLEHDYVGDLWKRHGWVVARNQAVTVGEARSDYDIINELGKRCTDPQLWWPTLEEAWDEILSPAGMTWQQFKKRGFLQGERKFKKYQKHGFRTPTGKVEIFSTVMERLGYDPLPGYNDPMEAPWSAPELAPKYLYQLITGARIPFFFHSENRQSGFLRSRRPDPLVELHPELAEAKGIKPGDWVTISSARGSVVQKAVITERVQKNVVAADHGWWFPEDKDGLGWDRSNINVLTDNSYASTEEAMGSTSLRVLLCNVEKAPEPKA